MKPSDAAQIEEVFRAIDRPIWVLTAGTTDQRSGLVATWVMQASVDPQSPRVMAGLAPNHFTAELALASRAFGLHLISAAQIERAWRFALGSGRDRDKFAGMQVQKAVTGAPILHDSLAWLDCRVITHFDAGDRLFFLAEVVAGERIAHDPPLSERALLAAATPEQLTQLRADMAHDIDVQRPLLAKWLERLSQQGSR